MAPQAVLGVTMPVPVRTFSNNGCATSYPNTCIDPTGTWQGGWLIKADGNVRVAKRNLITDAVTTFDITASTVSGNPMNLPFPIPLTDDHYSLSGIIDSNGKIHLSGNMFVDPVGCLVSGANSITTWTDGRATIDTTGTGANAHTYGLKARLPEPSGACLWLMDQREVGLDPDGTDPNGNDWLLFYLDGFGLWQPVSGTGYIQEIARTFDTAGDPTDADRVYCTGMTVTPEGRVFIAGIWRLDALDANTQKNPWIIWTDDLMNGYEEVEWYAMDGDPVEMPIMWSNYSSCAITSHPTPKERP